jgi:hypothetical protein
MSETRDYRQDAIDDARETARNFEEQILERLMSYGGAASNDLYNDYPGGDDYHHEYHVDRYYTLLQAANLLDQLNDHEETDSGLWDGQSPRKAVAVQAAHTYGNAVMYYFVRLITHINGEFEQALEDEVGSGTMQVIIDARIDAAYGDKQAQELLRSLGASRKVEVIDPDEDEDKALERERRMLAPVVLNRLISEWNG